MNRALIPPPPPTDYRIASAGAKDRPTYWLYTEEKGIAGPYTKSEARKSFAAIPGVATLACREGEEWQDAATRLAKKKAPVLTVGRVFAFIAIVALIAGGVWWWSTQKDLGKKRNAAATPSISSPAE